ncbi:helix-turn-helix domain-containing protein [Comamonas sp. C11]|uniref:helix-turn-helix domain-containing protein n=1 Tax=Comamonas sp. C11 TaxID=2966554 RepID=UPI0021128F07|nr:helix-turn-helix transcriptional regulator [Comamonas sp. C11]UUC94381.1 helix-turn-helix domain-containing protein [Comamonas sp. C11]
MPNKRPSPEVSLGKAVRSRRLELGWSQEDLGFEAGIHRTYVGVIERGEKSISIGSLVHLAETLGVKASDLLREAGL